MAAPRLDNIRIYDAASISPAAAVACVLAAAQVQDRMKRRAAARDSHRKPGAPSQLPARLGLAQQEIPEWEAIRRQGFSVYEAAEIIKRSRR